MTSGLVDVETAAPGAASSDGMTMLLVLPEDHDGVLGVGGDPPPGGGEPEKRAAPKLTAVRTNDFAGVLSAGDLIDQPARRRTLRPRERQMQPSGVERAGEEEQRGEDQPVADCGV
jgi:hypothetical protein